MICIKYFGAIAEVTNCSSETIEKSNSSLKEIIQDIQSRYDLKHIPLKFALNQNIIEAVEEIEINENDEIAVLPPFAGG
ncbi:MoaD/ThiS family protein [Gramella jeungdoensis]|uniref:MoaD/ThiS family protein n=1 Tax=Gramella jeungdoensis TaxID=708091 RepID=A0ABT0Z102_9FLAO|nr:MoaD/ThiS family protein [Gramella jeungdoensis]MCM8569098.1 MoaD/ThiS family protein [Gramella jeungdoensis]